jgi:alkylation response protein AidB-like acyl-CoA dehydrogenase
MAIPGNEELIGRARDLVPLLRQRAAETNANRRVADDLVAEMARRELLGVLQPEKFGGLQKDYTLFIEIIMALAQGCGSAAWVYGILGESMWILASFSEAAQREVWGKDKAARAAASIVPVSAAERVEGGWRLSGRWPFASGCDHAQWAILGAVTGSAGARRTAHDFLMPLAELAIEDDWQVLGLAGTGSKSLIADKVFVPDHRTMPHDDLQLGKAPGALVHPDYPLCRTPRSLLASMTLVSVMVGLAQRAVELFVEHTKGRVSRGVKVAESEIVQLRLAEAAAEVDTATLLLRTICARNVAAMAAGEAITQARIAESRRDIVFVVKLARQAVDRIYDASGAHALYDASSLQRVYRDVQAAASHLFLKWEVGALPYGKLRLGIGVDGPL